MRLALIIALTLLATQAQADPRWHGGGQGRGWGGGGGWHGGGGGHWSRPWQGPVWRPRYENPIGSFAGGIIGGAIGSIFRPADPVVVVQPDPLAYCAQRYRSWDPYTRTYLGFDGLRHACP